MTTLHIGRLSATAPVPDRERVDRLLRDLAEHHLDTAMREAGLPDGLWHVRRLDLRLPLDPGRPDPATAGQWARAVLDALRRALTERPAGVVYYRDRRAMVLDLVASLAAGRSDRAWVWERAGLPVTPAGAAIVAVLRRHPEMALGVVLAVVRRGGITPLARTLSGAEWAALAQIVTAATRTAAERRAIMSAEPVVSTSVLVGEARRARLRLDDRMARALAALAVAEVEPGRESLVEPVAEVLVRGEAPVTTERAAEDAETVWTTGWGGLLFLLNTAAEAGLPGLADEVFPDRPLRWVLHAAGRTIAPLTSDDPAGLALAGRPPTDAAPFAAMPAPSDAERAALERVAARWVAVTLARLDVPEKPHAMLGLLARRARVVAEPGWIELHLDLDSVDVDVRRAGLDLDPGWVPWLGAVVRFVYV